MKERRVGFVFDFTSIPSLLAFRPTCALADECEVAVDWLPFRAPRRTSAPKGGGETVAERHRRVRAAYLASDNARYTRWQGIDLRRDGAGLDSALAHAACLWANRHGVGRAFLERVWFAFWAEEWHLDESGGVAETLAAVGAPGFDESAANGLLTEQTSRLVERGVFGVPTYLAGDDLFHGRAHLPMIRSLLGAL